MQHKHPADIRLAVVISGINEKNKKNNQFTLNMEFMKMHHCNDKMLENFSLDFRMWKSFTTYMRLYADVLFFLTTTRIN